MSIRSMSRRDLIKEAVRVGTAASLGSVSVLGGLGRVRAEQRELPVPRIAYTSPTLPSYVNTIVGPLDFGPRFGLNFSEFQLLRFESHATATQTVLAGRAEVVAGSTASHLILREQGRDFKIFAPFLGVDDFVLAVNEKVRSVEDLFNPSVRVASDSAGGAGYLILEAFLEVLKTGRRVRDIPNLVVLESSGLRTTAIANGDVDASIIHVDQFERANQAAGGRLRTLVTLYDNVPLYVKESFAAPASWIDRNLEVATALVAALISANRALMRDLDYFVRSVRRIIRGGGPPDEELRKLWNLIRRYPFWGINDELLQPDRIGYMIDLCRRSGLLQGRLSAEDAVDLRPVQRALAMIGRVSRQEFL